MSLGRMMSKEKRDLRLKMIKQPTETERIVWRILLEKNKEQKKRNKYKPIPPITTWRQQALILGYIVDFYCEIGKLALEVDGEYHKDRGEYDKKRDQVLLSYGIKTIRITNKEVLSKGQPLIDDIHKEAQRRAFSIDLIRRKSSE